MAAIDVDKALQPVSDDAPCGENLEYDPAFTALEIAAKGKAEHVMGDEVIPAEEPQWRDVLDAAEELMGRTKDLRVAVYLTQAGLNVEGVPALAAGLRLIHGLLQNFWDSVFPELDAEDNDDPTLRVNSLVALNDRDGLIRGLDRATLVNSKQAGRYSLRQIRLASGEFAAAEGEETPDPALVDAAFMDCDLDELTATADAVKEASAARDLIDAFLREQVGAGLSPDLDVLGSELKSIRSLLAEHLARRGVTDEADADAGSDGAAAGGGGAAVGEIRSREDVVRILDRMSEYFRKNEPSSPVPLLLQRAKRLVSKDFMEILRDLTPDGVSQAEKIGGVDNEG